MRRSFLTGVAIYFVVLLNLFGEVQVGDSAAQVEQTMGAPVSRGKVGDQETLSYKNGTIITLKDGVVTDVSVRGRITIGTVTKVVGAPPPAPSPTVASARESTNKVAAAAPAKKPEATPAQAKAEPSAEPKIAETKPTTAKTKVTKKAAAISLPKAAEKSASGVNALLAGILIGFGVVFLGVYALYSYCFKLICEKTGHEPSVLVWIPIARYFPLLRVAKMPGWMLVFMLIPGVNYVFGLILWGKVCTARNKSPWFAAVLLIPLGGLFLVPYLAFTAANEELDNATPAGADAQLSTDSAAKSPAEQAEEQPPGPADSGETAPEQPAMVS